MEIVLKFIKPKRLPEANIQAEVYRQLRNKGIKCCLEYRFYIESMNSYIRADVIIIQNDNIVAIIECKSRKKEGNPNKDGRQYQKYRALGIPFIYCMTFKEVPKIVNEAIILMERTKA